MSAPASILTLAALLAGFGSATQAADQSAAASAGVEISSANADKLAPIVEYAIPQGGGYSGQLAADGGRLYLQTPFPHSILAFAPAQKGTPLWSVTLPGDSMVLALDCCSATIGGPAFDRGRLYVNTFDGRTVALDAGTGATLWTAQLADPNRGETLTLPPLVIGEAMFVGNSGDDYGARGWIAALSALDGHLLWKHFNAGSDADVGIGKGFAPPYPHEKGSDLGVATWPSDAWQHGGGLAGRPLHDAELNLLIYGTGHPAPWNPDLRPGDNKWTSGIFARDAKSGDARWFAPINAGDPYAFGAAGTMIAADISWQGGTRPLLIHPDANGFVYVIDRRTGGLLAADPFVPNNSVESIDIATGAARRNDSKAIHTNTTTRDICPAWPGATGVNGLALSDSAFSPEQGLLFIPMNGFCMDMEGRNTGFMAGTAFTGANLRAKPEPGRARGGVIAWDVARRQIAWRGDETYPVQSGVLLTGDGVLFYGTLDGWFKALDAASGKMLWQFRAGSGIISKPIAFRDDHGKPYVAVVAGVGGPIGRVAQNGIDLRDATAAHGYANALRDLPTPSRHGGTLYVFCLP